MLTFLSNLWNKISLYVIVALAALAAYFGISAKYNKKKAFREKSKREQAESTGRLSEERREVAEVARQRDTEEVSDAAAGRRNQMEKDW